MSFWRRKPSWFAFAFSITEKQTAVNLKVKYCQLHFAGIAAEVCR